MVSLLILLESRMLTEQVNLKWSPSNMSVGSTVSCGFENSAVGIREQKLRIHTIFMFTYILFLIRFNLIR